MSPRKPFHTRSGGAVDPNRQAVVYLAVVCAVTVLGWAAALVGCNDRTRPVVEPAELPLSVFQKDAKSTALEMAHRLFSGDLDAAAQLSRGAASERVRAHQSRCAQAPGQCAPPRPGAVTRAEVLSVDGVRSRVRVETFAPSPTGLERVQRALVEVASTADGLFSVVQYELEPSER